MGKLDGSDQLRLSLGWLTLVRALLDAAAHGLRELPRVRFESLPRMADFASGQ
jgi:hypothetical protein